MGVDGGVYALHLPPRFRQGDERALVVAAVIGGEGALPAVFEPFVRHLVAADLVLPHGGGHGVEVLRVVDVDAARGAIVEEDEFRELRLHLAAAADGEAVAHLQQVRRGGGVQQMQGGEARAVGGQCLKEGHAAGQRQAGEVHLQKLGVTAAILGAVQHGVEVVEDGLRGDALRQAGVLHMAALAEFGGALGLEYALLFQAAGQVRQEGVGEVRAAARLRVGGEVGLAFGGVEVEGEGGAAVFDFDIHCGRGRGAHHAVPPLWKPGLAGEAEDEVLSSRDMLDQLWTRTIHCDSRVYPESFIEWAISNS